jgi:outer membrane protein TolC
MDVGNVGTLERWTVNRDRSLTDVYLLNIVHYVFSVHRGQAERTAALIAVVAGALGWASPAARGETPPPSHAPDDIFAGILGVPGGLTADESGQRAAATSPLVAAKSAEVTAAASAVDEALALFAPRVTGLARYTRQSEVPTFGGGNLVGTLAPIGPLPPGAPVASVPAIVFPNFSNVTFLQANVVVPVSDYVFRLFQTHAAATASERSARLGRQAARLKANTDTQVLYYSWVQARLEVEVALAAERQARAHLEDAHRIYESGDSSPADVLMMDARAASSELLTSRARHLAALLEDQLRTALHDKSTRPYTIGEAVLVELAPLDDATDIEKLYAEALTKRPELRALVETGTAQRSRAGATVATMAPRLELYADVYYANPNPRFIPPVARFDTTWDVGVQAVWAPNDLFIGAARRQEIRSQADSTDGQRAALQDAIRTEVMGAWQRLDEAQIAITVTTRELRSAEESYRVRREEFAAGRTTSVALIDADLALTRARLEVVTSHVGQRVARLQLAHAVGRDATNAERD